MIKINFSQIYTFDCSKTEVGVEGTVLTYNGGQFDLSEIPDGATVNHSVIQNCTRTGDNYELTLTVHFTGELPDNYGKMETVEVTDKWQLEYEHTKGKLGVPNDLA